MPSAIATGTDTPRPASTAQTTVDNTNSPRPTDTPQTAVDSTDSPRSTSTPNTASRDDANTLHPTETSKTTTPNPSLQSSTHHTETPIPHHTPHHTALSHPTTTTTTTSTPFTSPSPSTPIPTISPSPFPSSTYQTWTHPQRAAIITSTLLSLLGLLLTLLAVQRIHRDRKQKIAELERGPGVDEDESRRGRKGRRSRSRSRGRGSNANRNVTNRGNSRADSAQDSRRHHDQQQRMRSRNCPNHPSNPTTTRPASSIRSKLSHTLRPPSPLRPKRRGIQGLDGIRTDPGPAALKVLLEGGGGKGDVDGWVRGNAGGGRARAAGEGGGGGAIEGGEEYEMGAVFEDGARDRG